MPPKYNPLKLNKLQLKTLTIFQHLASEPTTSSKDEATGEVTISLIPQPHGNHFHVGSRIVMSRDASGLQKQAVWNALERKGLAVANFPIAIRLTPGGIDYDTGLAGQILIGSDH